MRRSLARSMEYSAYFTAESARRKPSAIRALQPLVSLPGMISLGGGMPNSALFPFKKMSLTLEDGSVIESSGAELNAALQYSPTPGLPDLVKRLTIMQRAEHQPPEYEGGFSVAVVPGSQDGLAKIFDMLISEEDSLLIEAPTYSGTLAALEAKGCNLVGVPTDDSGLNPENLRHVLDEWTPQMGKKPRVLYTIPTGANPTGASMSMERKREVYRIAQEHDLLIVEDDPYYYMQYAAMRTPKILSSGVRIGVVTGPKQLVEQMCLHNQATIMHASGLAQHAVLSVLRHWGKFPLWEDHLGNLNTFYQKQCDAFFEAADKYLVDEAGQPLAEYKRPTAGMFVWMKLKGVADSTELIMTEAVEKKVLLVPGSAFYPGAPKSSYVRAAFSVASVQQMETAMQRFGAMLRDAQLK
eukprot:GSChrysophyteH1.ASY1.ANO1.1848.1 assembled CDS